MYEGIGWLFEKHISVGFIFFIIYKLETTQNRKIKIFLCTKKFFYY